MFSPCDMPDACKSPHQGATGPADGETSRQFSGCYVCIPSMFRVWRAMGAHVSWGYVCHSGSRDERLAVCQSPHPPPGNASAPRTIHAERPQPQMLTQSPRRKPGRWQMMASSAEPAQGRELLNAKPTAPALGLIGPRSSKDSLRQQSLDRAYDRQELTGDSPMPQDKTPVSGQRQRWWTDQDSCDRPNKARHYLHVTQSFSQNSLHILTVVSRQ